MKKFLSVISTASIVIGWLFFIVVTLRCLFVYHVGDPILPFYIPGVEYYLIIYTCIQAGGLSWLAKCTILGFVFLFAGSITKGIIEDKEQKMKQQTKIEQLKANSNQYKED